jgi:hypothetical protein
MVLMKNIRGFTRPAVVLGTAATFTIESLTGPGHERKQPHAEETGQSEPRPLGKGTVVWQSTASSYITVAATSST